MSSAARIALATVVAVALVSVGVDAAVHERRGWEEPAACGAAELTVYQAGTGFDTGRYANLSGDARAAFDRTKRAGDRTTAIDPGLVAEFPGHVPHDGSTYRTSKRVSEYPVIRGVPGWLDPVLVLFLLVHSVFLQFD